MNRLDSTGAENGIDFDASQVGGKIPASVIDAKINAANDQDRWYPVGLFENVIDVRAENITQSFNSGNSVKIKDGVRTFEGLMIKKSPDYIKALQSFGCGDIAVMHVDADGNLIGESLDGNFLRAINIDENTFSAIFGKTTDTEVSAITMSYAYSQTVDDSNLSMITADGFDSSLKDVRGLLDVTPTLEGAASTTTFTAKFTINYGSAINDKLVLKGLIAGDFTLYNVTQSASVTIDSVDTTNQDSGLYVINYSVGVSSSDVLTLDTTKTGYSVSTLTVTVA
jgi:hypothetical protein